MSVNECTKQIRPNYFLMIFFVHFLKSKARDFLVEYHDVNKQLVLVLDKNVNCVCFLEQVIRSD